jgi:hypothetical protein
VTGTVLVDTNVFTARLRKRSPLAWLCGQWHYGARHHCFSSPLARRVFHEVLPRQLDPTRGWGLSNVPRRG